MRAARAGLGLAFIPEDLVLGDVEARLLVRVPADWCVPFSGHHLYFPSRRQATPAFTLLVEALRYRGPMKRTRDTR
jgi:DNA-binding transcriptional LysR family regulator